MAALEIRAATFADIAHVALRMRAEDRAEVDAVGLTPERALLDGYRRSAPTAFAVHIEGEPVAIYGVVPMPASFLGGRRGSVWMLTTRGVERHAKTFWRGCLEYIPALFAQWDVLYNFIDVRHTKALRWAERLGFQLLQPAPYGGKGQWFCEFVVRKENLRCVHPQQ